MTKGCTCPPESPPELAEWEGNTTCDFCLEESENQVDDGCPHCGYMDCEWPDAKCVSDTQAYERDRKNWLDRLVE